METSRCRASFDGFRRDDSWREVARIEPSERFIFKLGRRLGLDRLLPEDLGRKLTRPLSAITIDRIEPPKTRAESMDT